MDTPEHLGAREVPTKFRVGDVIRVNTHGYTHCGVARFSEHRVVRGEVGNEPVVFARYGEVRLRPQDCSFVQRAPAMSHDRHREEEIIGGGHAEPGFTQAELADYGELASEWPKAPSSAKDMVNLPDHYARFPIEPIRFVVENAEAFKDPRVAAIMAHVIPYLLRHEFKGGIQDLEKAIRLLHMLIKLEQGDPDWWQVDRRTA